MKKLLFVAVAAALAGCATGPGRGYLDTEEDVYGKSSRMEYSQKHRKVAESVERLLTDPMFTTNYDKARKRAADAGRALPTISINPIENNTGDGRSDSEAAGQLYRELLTAIRKTGKFAMIDRMRRKQMTAATIAGNNAGEDASALQSAGNYVSADFVMTGELRREATDDGRRQVFHHFLNLELIDSASGVVFWSDSMPVAKFDAR
ncbi:MAG: hypothetical protein ACI4RD_08280 [Kiritimatiellia bacterium]